MVNAISSFIARRRFRPTLWPTLGLVVLLMLTVSLGNWQRHRAAEKEAMRDQFLQADHEPPLDLSGAVTDPAALRFRLVRAAGEFDASHTIFIDNKVQSGRAGYHVVNPFKVAEDRFVLVDRGWISQGATRSQLPDAPPPGGKVVIEGRVNLPPSRYLELDSDSDGASRRVWQNLDIGRIAKATGLALLPFVIEQTVDTHDRLVRDWPPPDFGIEQHLSYMLQWYSLAVLGCVLWLTLNWRLQDLDGGSRNG